MDFRFMNRATRRERFQNLRVTTDMVRLVLPSARVLWTIVSLLHES